MEQIRLARIEDAAYIALLGRITFTEAFGHLFHHQAELRNYLSNTFSVEKIERSLQKKNNRYWIAFVNRLPVGYAKLKVASVSEFISSKKCSQLQKIYVLRDFLSMKIGKGLQDRLLDKAKEMGSEHIWLSVYKENLRAISFYEKNDFRAIGAHDFKIGSQRFDFLAMAKKLERD